MLNIQATGIRYGETITIKQISKIAAKKLFKNGEVVFLQSSNMHPFNAWQSVCRIEFDKEREQITKEFNKKYPDSIIETGEVQFNRIVNEFKYYNCCSERGKYVHFYKKI